MKPSEVLTQALGLIETGWTRHKFHEIKDGVNCYCASGAINMVEVGSPEVNRRDSRAKDLLRASLGVYYLEIWNDNYQTTWSQKNVIAGFKSGIEFAKMRGE